MMNNMFEIRELNMEEALQVSGGNIVIESSATGTAIGAAVGVGYASAGGYSAAGVVAAGTGSSIVGAALGAAFGMGYVVGTLLSDAYGSASSYFGGSGSLGGDIYDFFAS